MVDASERPPLGGRAVNICSTAEGRGNEAFSAGYERDVEVTSIRGRQTVSAMSGLGFYSFPVSRRRVKAEGPLGFNGGY